MLVTLRLYSTKLYYLCTSVHKDECDSQPLIKSKSQSDTDWVQKGKKPHTPGGSNMTDNKQLIKFPFNRTI